MSTDMIQESGFFSDDLQTCLFCFHAVLCMNFEGSLLGRFHEATLGQFSSPVASSDFLRNHNYPPYGL